jgi:hypothetical protein
MPDVPPAHWLRASRLMRGLSLAYGIIGAGLLSCLALGRAAVGPGLLAWTGHAKITIPNDILASMLLFAPAALLLYLGGRAVLAGKPWGRVAGFMVAGLAVVMFFPYGIFASAALFWGLTAGWALPKLIKIKRPTPNFEPLTPKVVPAAKVKHTPWNTNEFRARWKRSKPRSR